MSPRERLARSAVALEPLKQGDLDGLCGLYSIINAITLAVHPVRPASAEQQHRLFVSGVRWLKRQGLLADAVVNGMTMIVWHRLTAVLVRKYRRETSCRLTLAFPLRGGRLPGRQFVRDQLQAHLQVGAPILLSLDGTYDHFTVASGFSTHRLTLFDSDDAHWVRWSSLGDRSQRHFLRRQGAIAILVK